MRIFSYQIERIDRGATALDEHLNEFGRDGWELVSVLARPDGGMDWYFKRPRLESVPLEHAD